MDLVVPDNRTAICPDLDPCQGVAVDVVSFNETSAITKNINTTLVAIKNGIAPVFRQNNEAEYSWYLLKLYKQLIHTHRQPGQTDLIVGSLLEVIHTPAKLFA